MKSGLPSERQLHHMSQLAYLDIVPRLYENDPPTVGALADYYTQDPVGSLYLKSRFCAISAEYKNWLQFLSRDVEPYRHYRILHTLNDNAPNASGFYGCAFDTESQGLIIAFRGSELLGNPRYKNDYRTDLGLAYMEKTPQQQLVDTYFARFPELAEQTFAVTGHSLGGNLAAYAAVCAPMQLKRRMTGCYSFNGPGFCEEFLKIHEPDIASANITLFQNRFDPVSSLLKGIAEPVLLGSAIDPLEHETVSVGTLFYPHSNFTFLWDGDFLIRAEDSGKSLFCRAVKDFSDLFLKLPKLLREGVCKLLLEALYLPYSPKKEMGYLLESVLKYLTHHIKSDSIPHLELTSAIYGARMLLSDRQMPFQFDEKLKATEEHGGVSVSDAAALLLMGLQLTCGD